MNGVVYPFKTIGEALNVRLAPSGVVRFDDVPSDGLVLPDQRLVQAYRVNVADWRVLDFQLAVELQDADKAEPFEKEGPLSLVVTALCGPTNVRHRVELPPVEGQRFRWAGPVTLQRESFVGKVVLRCLLVGTVGGVPNRPLAYGQDWTIHVDDPPSLKLQGTLRVVWKDFKAADAPPLAREFPTATHVVDLDETPVPVLYLNQSFEDGFHDLLRDKKTRSPQEKALHDQVRLAIARSVWHALFQSAASAVEEPEEGGEPAWPTLDWQAEVLREVLPDIFKGKGGAEDALRELIEARHGGWNAVLARAEGALGELIEHNKTLRGNLQRLAREVVTT
jgi:hypothetical protein